MRILLDLQGAQTDSRFRGIGRYSLALAEAIARNAGPHEVHVLANATMPEAGEALDAAFSSLLPARQLHRFAVPRPTEWSEPANAWRRGAAERLRETFIADLEPDLVHVSSLFEGAENSAVTSVGRLGCSVPTAVTLYDLIPLLNPEAYLGDGWVRDWYMDKLASLRRADLLLAISAHAREEGIATAGLDPARVVNIRAAASPVFTAIDAGRAGPVLARLGIDRPFVMYSGAADPRKNVVALIDAFARLPAPLRTGHRLVLAGRMHAQEIAVLRSRAAEHRITDELVFTGYVTDNELVALYSSAALFVLPSLHEGFGLPALEAMSCGAPTLGSNATSVPEVIGREDALFDPRDAGALASLMGRALSTGFGAELREHARHQAAVFSWDRCARDALDAFEALREASADRPRGWAGWTARQAGRRAMLLDSLGAIDFGPLPPDTADLAQVAIAIEHNRRHAEAAARAEALPDAIGWRVEGPFDSSYSLALLNRETALALAQLGHDVALHSTEGPGDFEPAPAFLQAHPEIAALHAHSREVDANRSEVCSRNLYPPRVHDMQGRFNLLHHYAWEESGFPQAWVREFNDHLQGITCLSTHVQKVLVDSGVDRPMAVSGCGVDHWERVQADAGYRVEAKGFRFLHVSSCFPRKGADVLLRAYGAAFSAADDVSLVIKTFANPHNEVHRWLEEARSDRADFPDVRIIEADLSDACLKSLYQQCHVLVAPSRAEGYGLPMAEAMLSGLAVVTTGWGGQLDFCDERTAWLLDYRFAPAQSHFRLFGSVWAEPDEAHLATTLRELHGLPETQRTARAQAGRERLLARSRWVHVAQRLADAVRHWAAAPVPADARIGWVTTWNTPCGIATYSAHLLDAVPAEVAVLAAEAAHRTAVDGPAVIRCWHPSDEDTLERLAQEVDARGLDTLVIQFQYGFFRFPSLDAFIRRQKAAARVVVLMMHATVDPAHAPHKKLADLQGALALCDRVLVHSTADLNRMKALGLVHNVALFPHGVVDFAEPGPRASGGPYTVCSYGFLLPHKGLAELIDATGLLRREGRDVRLHMLNAEYPIPASAELASALRQRIAAQGLSAAVELDTTFHDDGDSLRMLQQADLIVFPYQATGESSSAAVRYGLATRRPVAVTPLPIFDDVQGAVAVLPGADPRSLADGIARLMDEGFPALESARWLEEHRYSGLGERLLGTLRQLRLQMHAHAAATASAAPGSEPGSRNPIYDYVNENEVSV